MSAALRLLNSMVRDRSVVRRPAGRRRRVWRTGLLLLVLLLGVTVVRAPAEEDAAEGVTFFREQVAPLLARRCLGCHNREDRKGGLDLTSAEGARTGGDTGPAISAGGLDQNLLWQRIAADEMPPDHPLPEGERQTIRAWWDGGGTWDATPIDRFQYSSESRAGYDWWSLTTVVRPEVPKVVVGANDAAEGDAVERAAAWQTHPVDRFLWPALRAQGLWPSTLADRRTLIRRLSFDLTGLPPAPAEVEAFVADDAPHAYERLVDRLLASPQYGVRWARHWLDVVRFGESNGFEYDEFRPDAWPYRDWVVSALNDDLPYDEFARRQLAGDVLWPGDLAAAVATGFLVAGAYDTAGQNQQSLAMRAVVRQDEMEDIVGTVGQTFLGLTVHCARCHDHKFDPIRQRDYYALSAALAGVRHGVRELSGLELEGPRLTQVQTLMARRNALRSLCSALEDPVRERLLSEQRTEQPDLRPVAEWDFRRGASELRQGLATELHGGAQLGAEGLVLDGATGYAVSAPLGQRLRAKTLEAWVRLGRLDQRGGAVLSVETPEGATFDALVFAEQEPQQWMAGSNGFVRTRSFHAPQESEAHQEFVHLCLTYAEDGEIRAYRHGVPYGEGYSSGTSSEFAPGGYHVLFGLRHRPSEASRLLQAVVREVRLYDRALSADEVAVASGRGVTQAALLAALSEEERSRHAAWSQELAQVERALATLRPVKAYTVTPRQPEATHLLKRGNPAQPAEVLAAGALQAVRGLKADFELPDDAPEGERRRRLAEWITARENPLFARVMVNRVWQHHFGRGLVETPNDFGLNGGRPSHPELLDWLASEFASGGFRLKGLHRLLVTSAAYRQSSRPLAEGLAVDADNRLLWRYAPRRLEAEAVRDTLLAVAGLLEERVGGPSFADVRRSVAVGTSTYLYEPDDPTREVFFRRTLYRAWARSGRSPFLDVLDCPDPSTTSPRRNATTTPLQALALWNNALVLHVAERFAERVVRESSADVAAQAARAFELALGRGPTEVEQAAAVGMIREHGPAALARTLFNTNEFVYVD